MNENIKIAASCWVRYMLCALFGFFIYLSISVFMVGAYTENIGYQAFNDDGELLYTHYYTDGEDQNIKKYEAEGTKVTTNIIRSELSGTPKLVTVIIGQVLTGAITIAFIYKKLWNTGDNDANLVKFGHKKYNHFRGLIIGLIAIVPNFVSWIILVLSKTGILSANLVPIFRFCNYQVFSISEWLLGTGVTSTAQISWINILAAVTVCLLLPIVAYISYLIGYRRISLKEKIIYKKER